jgi:hypothetical protein
MTTKNTIAGITFTDAALRNIEEAGLSATTVAGDVLALRARGMTAAELLNECLNGADDDRVRGWHDYVAAVADAAKVWHD